jgi:hypothetical protein
MIRPCNAGPKQQQSIALTGLSKFLRSKAGIAEQKETARIAAGRM